MWFKLLILLSFISQSFSKVRYQTGSLSWTQTYRVFWSEDISIPNTEACEAIVILGVGTSMSTSNYNELASRIVEEKPYIVVIADHNHGCMMKLFAWTFRTFYNKFMDHLEEYVPMCAGKEPTILIGGHSASGEAVINAIPQLYPKAHGFIGLDPYKVTMDMSFGNDTSIPTLTWGFKKTSCKVSVDWAGKIAYEISSPQKRIFYRIKNDYFDISHCTFTDDGCGFACGAQKGSEWVKHAVAISVQRFIEIIKRRGYSFSKSDFRIMEFENNYELFVNNDDPDSYVLLFSSDI